MRKVVSAVVATTSIFSATLSMAPALADTTPSPSPAPTSAPLSPFEQYRIDRENYFSAMKMITAAFKSACDRANSTYAASVSIAKSKDQKRAARVARENAITEATFQFENAKYELGPMPIEPLKVAKAPGKSKAKAK
jgi:hypothetical protein